MGVVVYSSKWRDINEFMLPYEALKKYIASCFAGVHFIIKEANRKIDEHKKKLMLEEIDESNGPLETLRIMRQKYAERYGEECAYDFELAIMCLSCPLTVAENSPKVSDFRVSLEFAIPMAAAAFRKLDYNNCLKALMQVCDAPLRGPFQGKGYYLGKVFTHLEHGDSQRPIAVNCARDLADKGCEGLCYDRC